MLKMNPRKKRARLAGLIYLVVVLTGIFSLAYVPSKLISWTNAGQTFQNISSSTGLFRLGIGSSMVCYIAFLLLPLALYQLLHSVDEAAVKLIVAFAMVSVPISIINLQSRFGVLSLVDGANHTSAYTQQQLESQVMALLASYNSGLLIVQVFWGLWLLPFGYLVYKSGFLPKLLGILLMMGCAGYLASTFGETLVPDYRRYSISRFVTLPASLGEIGTCLWLLIVGAKNNEPNNG